MRKVVQHRSKLMQDQPVLPGEWVTYWVEYVIRHRGALHLRCPAVHMPWYQLYNVDVWVTVIVVTPTVILLACYITYRILRCCCSACCRRNNKKSKQE
ncbi:hypothetical protein Pcinc_014840 [Petrolisthes cinctipes]|uniref:Uncharacterized protein n=1 Tax=Petrolisthes cinctipes TaxID=88211 RepID=A0AAE1FWZ8_PETCI|nr:hypothetical protein Pcinc_014840 [Petrolisthes cinctipes]